MNTIQDTEISYFFWKNMNKTRKVIFFQKVIKKDYKENEKEDYLDEGFMGAGWNIVFHCINSASN